MEHHNYEESARNLIEPSDNHDNDFILVAEAIVHNQPDVVRLVLDRGALVNRIARDRNEITPLHLAARRCHDDIVKLLLDRGFDVNARDGSYRTPLDHSINGNGHETICLLLENGANVNATDYWGRAPLHGAVMCSNSPECIKMLIERGANLEARDNFRGYTALHFATEDKNHRIVRLLLREGADVNASSRGNILTPLHIAVDKRNNFALVQLLIERGARIGALDVDRATPLHYASKGGQVDSVKLLLTRGANVNARNKYNSTPLLLAIDRGSYEIVKILLDYRPDMDDRRVLAFSIDCIKGRYLVEGHPRILIHEALKKYGFSLHSENPLDSLWLSLRRNFMDAKILISSGLKLNQIEDNHKFITEAILDRRENNVEYLAKNGVSVNSSGDHSQCPLIFAVEKQVPSIVKVLLDNGANPNNWDGPLHPLIKRQYSNQMKEILEDLLEHDIDMDSLNAISYEKVINAFDFGESWDTVSLLLINGANLSEIQILSDNNIEESSRSWAKFLDDEAMFNLVNNLLISGSYVSDYNLWRLERYKKKHMKELGEHYTDNCRAEVAKMRHKLFDGISLHQIFITDDLGYLSNQSLMDKLRLVNFGEFREYGDLIRNKLKRDERRLGRAREALNFLVLVRSTTCKDSPKRLPLILVTKIISQLSKFDQQNLALCGQILREQLLR